MRLHFFLIFFFLHFFAGFLATFLAHLVLAHEPNLSNRLMHGSIVQSDWPDEQPPKGFGRHVLAPLASWMRQSRVELRAQLDHVVAHDAAGVVQLGRALLAVLQVVALEEPDGMDYFVEVLPVAGVDGLARLEHLDALLGRGVVGIFECTTDSSWASARADSSNILRIGIPASMYHVHVVLARAVWVPGNARYLACGWICYHSIVCRGAVGDVHPLVL